MIKKFSFPPSRSLRRKVAHKAEIVVRNPEEIMQKVRCEIYRDIVRGLDINYLRKVIRENLVQKFMPEGNS